MLVNACQCRCELRHPDRAGICTGLAEGPLLLMDVFFNMCGPCLTAEEESER